MLRAIHYIKKHKKETYIHVSMLRAIQRCKINLK